MDDNSAAKVDSHQIDPEPNMCYEDTKPEFVAQTFFLLYITIATVVGNTAICCSIYHSQTLHRFSNYLVVSLALSDLMVAFFSLPMRIHQSLHNTNWCLSESTCVLWIWTDLACRCTCFANLALISVDRFVATRYPLKYHRIITQRGGQMMLIYIWFHGAVIASLGLHNWTSSTIPTFAIDNPLGCRKTPDPAFYTFATCVGFFLPLFIIGASYSYVFAIAWKHWKSTNRVTLPEPPCLAQGDVASKRFTLTREIRAAKTLAIVISALICCWLPFFIILMALFWCSTCFTRTSPFVNITFIYILPNISSALNPFIFFIFSQRLRRAFYNFCAHVKKSILCLIQAFCH
ncbi:putative G-protein coupled receptor No18 [Oculina patagonica]